MIICICNNISDKKIKQVAKKENIENIAQLQQHISICNQCRMCKHFINDILHRQKQQETPCADNIVIA